MIVRSTPLSRGASEAERRACAVLCCKYICVCVIICVIICVDMRICVHMCRYVYMCVVGLGNAGEFPNGLHAAWLWYGMICYAMLCYVIV